MCKFSGIFFTFRFDWCQVTSENIDSKCFTVSNLAKGQQYKFRVMALNEYGLGPHGDETDFILMTCKCLTHFTLKALCSVYTGCVNFHQLSCLQLRRRGWHDDTGFHQRSILASVFTNVTPLHCNADNCVGES